VTRPQIPNLYSTVKEKQRPSRDGDLFVSTGLTTLTFESNNTQGVAIVYVEYDQNVGKHDTGQTSRTY
jgi:hypothetical protein